MLWFSTANGRNLCQLCRNSPVAALSWVLTEACVLSRSPIVRACFIVACFSSAPRTAVTSWVTWALNCVPRSVMIVVGRNVCFYNMFIITLATDVAVMRVTGYANRYREKTSIAVIIWTYPPLGGRFGRMSI